MTIKTADLIELNGHVDTVVYVKENYIILRFYDVKRGHLLISTKDKDIIPLNCFYQKIKVMVELKGGEFKRTNGKVSTSNVLYIREVEGI